MKEEEVAHMRKVPAEPAIGGTASRRDVEALFVPAASGVAPLLKTGDNTIETAFRIALGDYLGNVQPWEGELAENPVPCILAGLDYDRPWTRDAAFNAWYAGSLVSPYVARNTLLAVLMEDEWGLRIGGQYWDAIVWVTAAWHHYLCTHDQAFLGVAFAAAVNALRFSEATEFDPDDGLFRGGACFQDGVAGYPDWYADGPTSGILEWVQQHPDTRASPGYGLPMKALSTNCLYYHAYLILPEMAGALELPIDPVWAEKAHALRAAINRSFWEAECGRYRYLVDAEGGDDRQEGFGHAFATLFGVADSAQVASVFARQYVTPHGIPCLWPTYERYADADGMSFGRHAGTIWPQVNAAWSMAAVAHGRRDVAWSELVLLAEKACRDIQFAELYHPITGEIYGGLQENPARSDVPVAWRSCRRQTWCATGYIRMVLSVLFGLRIGLGGLAFDPYLPEDVDRISLSNLSYADATLSIVVERSERGPYCLLDGIEQIAALFPAELSGPHQIRLGVTR